MRIQGIQVEHYGQYENFQLSEEQLRAPITVIYGANEAGKSTLHAFIRGVLFGFRPRGAVQHNYLSPQTVGSLTLTDPKGQAFQVVRSCPPKNGKVTIYQGQEQEEGEAALQHKLGGLSATLFQNIFCFSHQELQNVDTLQGEEIAAYLHSAAMGAGGLSLLDVEKKLLKQQELLFKPKAVNPQLNQLLSELEEQQQELRELQRKIGEYQPIQVQLERARNVLESKRRRRSLLEKERGLIKFIEQAASLQEKIKQLEAVLAGLQQTRSPILNNEAELYQLRAEAAVIREKEQEQVRIESQLKQLEEQIEQGLERLGEAWNRERIEQIQLSIPVREKLLQIMSELEGRDRKIQLLQEKVEEKQGAARRAEHKWKELHTDQLVLQGEQAPLRASRSSTGGGQDKRRALFWTGSAVVSVLLTIILWLQGQEVMGLTLGGALLLFATLFTFWGQKGTADNVERATYQHMQQELLAQQHRLVIEAQQEAQHYSEEAQRLQEQLAEEQQAWQELCRQSQRLLDQWGVGSLTRLTGVQSFFQQVEQTQQQVLHSRRLANRLQELKQDVHSWCNTVRRLAKDIGMLEPNRYVSPQAILEQLLIRLEEDLDVQRRSREQQAKLIQLQHEYDDLLAQILILQAKHHRAADHGHGQENDIEEDVDLGTGSELSSYFLSYFDSGKLDREELHLFIKQVTRVEMEEKASELAEKDEHLLNEMEQQALQIGHLQQKLKQLEAEDSLATLQHDFEQNKALFREKAKRWSAYAVARTLSAQTRQIYEEERQPSVLKQASHFFAAFTEGHYQQIIVPLGAKELVAVDRYGKRWDSVLLSKGTKEQLYLAMRFALIKEYEKQAVLPVILDDPFVHFDEQRLRQVFQGMLELGASHQLILFTCHQHYATLLQEMDLKGCVQVIDLELVKQARMKAKFS